MPVTLVAVGVLRRVPYPLIKVELEDGAAPPPIAGIQVAIGAAVLIAVTAVRVKLRGLHNHSGGAVGPFTLLTPGEQRVSSSLAGALAAAGGLLRAAQQARSQRPADPPGGRKAANVSKKTLLLFSGTSVIWGSSFLFIRVAVGHMPPSAVVFGRTLLGAAFLVPLAIKARTFRGLRSSVLAVVMVTLLDMALPTFLTAWGEQRISSNLGRNPPLYYPLSPRCSPCGSSGPKPSTAGSWPAWRSASQA